MEKPKILLVDDLEENLVSLEMLLDEFDVSFVRATSGMEALRKTLTGDFAMAILDVQMPGMDGYETLSLMRKRKKTKYLPVIFVSAIHQSDLHIIKGIETGAVDFIPKPVIPEILIGKVKIFLDLYFQKQELKNLLEMLEVNNRELEIQKLKAEEATRVKSMFLANMSHEIRTPLNGIIGISRILEQTTLEKNLKELVRIISTSGENLLNIINDILDFSKIESGQVELENLEFELSEVITNIVRLLKFNADEKGIGLSVHIDKRITGLLIGDPYRLTQIVTNLLNNAIKFTEKGYVRIEVEQASKEAEQVELLFKVIDTGIGISLNGSKKLFKEFSQTESSTTRKFGGTGLGLAICSNLVSLMGGEIGVNSTFGEGSAFWFRLKFSYLEKQKTIIKKDNFIVPDTLKILCAEDNMVNQRVTQLLLKNIGTECEIAENGKLAYEMAQKKNFDIILMDMQMPVIDGIESTCKIREYEALNKVVKPAYIVAVTANATSEDRQKCLSAGMNDFLSKPFQASELINIIKNVVSNS
jgi:two-component system, sensor histidine kinase